MINKFIVTAELYRKGFLIKSYSTLEQAEKKVEVLMKLSRKYPFRQIENFAKDLDKYRKYEARNNSCYPIPCRLTSNGALNISVYETKINKNKFIESLIKAREFQETLFEIDVLDKIDSESIQKEFEEEELRWKSRVFA